MILFVSLAALAAQPGADAPVFNLDLGVAAGTGRTGVAAPTAAFGLTHPDHWFGRVHLDGVYGVDRGLNDSVEEELADSGGPAIPAPSGLTGFRAAFTAGWHHAGATRDPGLRLEVGLCTSVTRERSAMNWLINLNEVEVSGFDTTLRMGPDAFIGWAVAPGDDLKDPLWVTGVRASYAHPVEAWGFRSNVDVTINPTGPVLMGGRARIGLDSRLKLGELSLVLDPRMELDVGPATSRFLTGGDRSPAWVLHGGAGVVF